MPKTLSHSWTPEKLRLKSTIDVETIRSNAVRHGVSELVEMCEQDLRSRPPKTSKHIAQTAPRHFETDVVTGYHFVCARDRGVVELNTGRFWSGSWVVAEANVKKSLRYGAYLALHESRAEPSYRQGRILDYRRGPRDMLPMADAGPNTKIDEGIEFLVQASPEPYAWTGWGSGEKGYRWTRVATSSDASLGGGVEAE